jgi:hypothetical protein
LKRSVAGAAGARDRATSSNSLTGTINVLNSGTAGVLS